MCHLVCEVLDVGVVDFSLSGGLAGLQQPHGKTQHAKNAGANRVCTRVGRRVLAPRHIKYEGVKNQSIKLVVIKGYLSTRTPEYKQPKRGYDRSHQ